MRTFLIILGGLALWGTCLATSKVAGQRGAIKMDVATYVFAALWILIAAGNMWIGVARAGYSVREELPIFLLIAAVPIAIALFVRWKFQK